MKRITVELPDGVMCGFVNYVYVTKSGMVMGTTWQVPKQGRL